MFNALTMVKNLEKAGVPRQQAEAHAQALAEVVQQDLATKTDIQALEVSTKAFEASTKINIESLRTDVKVLETSMKRDFKTLEYKLVLKLSAIMGTMITILGVVISLKH